MRNILTILLAAILFSACTKEVTELPPATQTGADTFGAMVDGNFWVPKDFGPLNNDILQIRIVGNNVFITASDFSGSPSEKEFQIFLKDVTGPGTFQLNTDVGYPSTSAHNAYYVKRNFSPTDEWITSSAHGGSVTITKFDLANHIVSGTFQFTMGNLTNPSDVVTVTDGRFDIKTP